MASSLQAEAAVAAGGWGLAGRVASSNLLRLAAAVAVFAWYPLGSGPWFSMIDPDVWWQMRTGEWILQHHHVPRTDPFSITGAGHAWVAYSWPFGVLMHLIARNWDLLGIVAFTIGSWMVLTAALWWLLRAVVRDFWISAVLTGIGGVVLERVVMPRVGNFTILFFIFIFRILIVSRNRSFPKEGKDRAPVSLFLVPVMVWLWANVHLQFVYGLALIGAFAVEGLVWPRWGRMYAVRLWITLLASTVVTAITPYGLGPWRTIREFMQQPKLYVYSLELHAMSFELAVHKIVLLLSLAAAMALGAMKTKQPVWFLLLVFAAVQGFRSERDIWLLAVISLTVIGTWWAERSPGEDTVPRSVWLGAAACVLVVLAYCFKTAPSNRELMGRVARQMPVGAVAFIHEHHLQGPIFNNFDWGGFLIYALPEFPVSVDGRTNVHGQDELEHSMDTWNLMGNWHDDPLLVNANLVIGSPKFALTHALRLDPRWEMVFNDGVGVVYKRTK